MWTQSISFFYSDSKTSLLLPPHFTFTCLFTAVIESKIITAVMKFSLTARKCYTALIQQFYKHGLSSNNSDMIMIYSFDPPTQLVQSEIKQLNLTLILSSCSSALCMRNRNWSDKNSWLNSKNLSLIAKNSFAFMYLTNAGRLLPLAS